MLHPFMGKNIYFPVNVWTANVLFNSAILYFYCTNVSYNYCFKSQQTENTNSTKMLFSLLFLIKFHNIYNKSLVGSIKVSQRHQHVRGATHMFSRWRLKFKMMIKVVWNKKYTIPRLRVSSLNQSANWRGNRILNSSARYISAAG